MTSTSRQSRAEYEARVNRVLDYIDEHLHEPLSLETLARVACFSPYHFHRVFTMVTGEPLGALVQRLRLERAAMRLLASPDVPITTIALECGFSSSATFARAFRAELGTSASELRALARRAPDEVQRKIGKPVRKLGKAWGSARCHPVRHAVPLTWRVEMPNGSSTLSADVEVRELPERHVAYVRHVGPYGQPGVVRQLVERLFAWAAPRALVTPETRVLCVAHDSPKITDESKLRLSVCIPVPQGTRGEREIGTMTIAGGKYAVARFDIEPAQIAEAWDLVIGGWLPESGYQPDDRLSYELVEKGPQEHPEGRVILDICVPVRPL